jgi:mRNA interferase MazF
MTTRVKGYPFEVSTSIKGTRSVVLADHVRSVDWTARRAKRIGVADDVVVRRVSAIVAALVGVG